MCIRTIAITLTLILVLGSALCAQETPPKPAEATKVTLAEFKLGTEPDGFREVKWGTKRFEFRDLEPLYGGMIGKIQVSHYKKKNDDLHIGSVPVTDLAYIFAEDKFYGINAYFADMKAADWATLRDYLFKQYGEVQELNLQGNPAYIWSGDKTMIRLHKAGTDSFYLDIWSRNLIPRGTTKLDELQGAVQLGDLPTVRKLLEADPKLLNTPDDEGKTPLLYAINCHSAKLGKETIELLISKGADLNVRAKDGTTVLCRAVQLGMPEIAKLLIAKGADINAPSNHGTTPLIAAAHGEPGIAEFLVSKGADVNLSDDDERTALHEAASWGRADLVKLLVSKGARVNAKDNTGWTPLHGAAGITGSKEAAKVLIDNKANVNAKETDSGRTPLHVAVDNGSKDVVELLIASGADVNAKDNDGATPMKYAKDSELTDIIDLLRRNGATE